MTNNSNSQQTWSIWVPITLGLVTSLCLAIRLDQPIVAFDLWWHMLIGKHFLATNTLVFDHSILTWTEASPYFSYNAWISQIILHLIYEFADLYGLIVFRYVVFFGIALLALHYAFVKKVVKHPLSITIIAIGMMLCWTAFLVKPELFSIGFMSITVWLYYFIRSSGSNARYSPYLFPVLLVVWINSHGGFFISSIFFAGVIIGELLNAKFSPTQSMSPRPRFHLFIAFALCFPALLINPYGYELSFDIINTILTPEIHPNPTIMAYRPTSIYNGAPHYLLDYLIISMLLFILLIWQKIKNKETDWVAVVTFISYSALFIQMGRVTYFLAPVFIFSGLDLLSYKGKSKVWPTTKNSKRAIMVLCVSIIGLMSWRTWDDAKCDVVKANAEVNNRLNRTNAPIDETEYIKNNLSGKLVGNTYPEGGHLLYELWPDRRVLIDTREFPFRKWKKRHFDFLKGIKIEEFVNDHHADYWLINLGYIEPFIWFVKSNDWKLAYLGPIGAVFVPTSSAEHTATIISPNISSIASYNRASIALNAALQLEDMTFAKHIQKAVNTNLRTTCTRDIEFNNDINNVIKGYEAIIAGDYQTAVDALNSKMETISIPIKAIQAMELLANQQLNSGDYINARKWLISAYNKKPHLVDLYNLMLVDWEMRNTDKFTGTIPSDGINWKNHAEYIVNHEKELTNASAKMTILVDIAKAMLNKNYNGDANLVSRLTLMQIDKE